MFDLYFAGSQNSESEQFLMENKCNRLCSQLLDRKVISNWTQREHGKLFIDSGAYTAYTKQTVIDVDAYIDYINSIDEHITLFAQLDKIPGEHGKPKTKEQILEAPKLSWENYLYMRNKVNSPDKLLPIFHRREDFKWLKLMLETKFDGKHIPYIGIAATTDSSVAEKVEWFEKVFEVIKHSSNPNVKTHAFGMTSLKVLEQYPFTSADSTSWIMTGAMGSIMSPFGTISISEQQSKSRDYILHLPEHAQKDVKQFVENAGFNLEELSKDYKKRITFNAHYSKTWAENYEFKGSGVYKKKLF